MLFALNRTVATGPGTVAAGLAVILLLAACCRPALAQQTLASPEASTRDLAAEVLRQAGDGDLGDWTRSILDRALERAGETARQTLPGSPDPPTAPLPAERHAPSLAVGRANPAEVLVFTSLSVPAASWRQWAREGARIGAPLVLRGVGEGGLPATVKQIGVRLGDAKAGGRHRPAPVPPVRHHPCPGCRGGARRCPALREPGLRRRSCASA